MSDEGQNTERADLEALKTMDRSSSAHLSRISVVIHTDIAVEALKIWRWWNTLRLCKGDATLLLEQSRADCPTNASDTSEPEKRL